MNHTDDHFSVDEILDEIKQSHKPADQYAKADADRLIDEILKERSQGNAHAHQAPPADPFAAKTDSLEKDIPSVTMNTAENEPIANIPVHSDVKQEEAKPPIFRKVPPVPGPELSEQTYHGKIETTAASEQAGDDTYRKFRENRQKKIKDFVLFGEEDEVETVEAETDNETDQDKVIEEFDSMEDAPSVLLDLKELGTSLFVRLGLLLILFLMNCYLVAANTISFLPLPAIFDITVNPLMYTLASTVILGIAVIVSHTTVFGGLINLCKFKADGDSLPALGVLAAIVQCVVFLTAPSSLSQPNVHLYSFAAVLGLIFNCIGKLLIVKRTMLNFKYVTSDCDKYATTVIEDEYLANDLTKGVLTNIPITATNRKTKFLSGFLDMSFREDVYDALCRRLAPIVFAAAAILAVSGYMVTKNVYTTLTAVAGVFAICSSFFGLFAVNLPLLTAVKTVHKHGGMLIGYPAIDEFSDVNSATVQGHDLFPSGSVILHGIKTFKGMRIDDAILDAASILVEANSILSDIFMQVIQGKPELLKKVDTIVYEDMMGIAGWVDDRRVLIGSRDLMLNHGVDVPSKDYEKRYCTENNEIIYLSTSGELTAAFIVSLTADEAVLQALRLMESNDVFCIVKTVDPILTREKLAMVFDVEPNLFRVIPSRLHKAFDSQIAPSDKEEGFLANNGTLYGYIRTLTAAKRLKARVMLGIVVLMTSVIIGFGLITALCLFNNMAKLSVLYLIGYQLIWFAVAWLIQKFRSV